MEVSPLPDDYLAAVAVMGDIILRADCTEADAQQHVIMAVAAQELFTALYTSNNALRAALNGGCLLTGDIAKILRQQIAINNLALAKAGVGVKEIVL